MRKDNVKFERERTIENLDKIYLMRDGESSWYHAYEWSAYLAEFYKNNLSDADRLNPTHKTVKGVDGSVIQVGMQLSSLKKYLPNVDTESVSDNMVILKVNLGDYRKVASIEEMNGVLGEWKESVAIRNDKSNNKEKNEVPSNIYSSPTTFMGIMKMILKYDTNNKSEADLRSFVIALKNKCCDIIC